MRHCMLLLLLYLVVTVRILNSSLRISEWFVSLLVKAFLRPYAFSVYLLSEMPFRIFPTWKQGNFQIKLSIAEKNNALIKADSNHSHWHKNNNRRCLWDSQYVRNKWFRFNKWLLLLLFYERLKLPHFGYHLNCILKSHNFHCYSFWFNLLN